MHLGLQGKRALVCGASSGIGLAAAISLAREGADLVLVARGAERLTRATAEIGAVATGAVTAFRADLTSPAERAALLQAHPVTDLLITNPGVPQRPVAPEALHREQWDWWLEAHFHAAMHLIDHYVPGMMQRGFGRVVNVSVSFIKFPQSTAAPSHAARLALAGALAALARRAIANGVTVNSVLPGLVDTPALRAALQGRADAQQRPFEQVLTETLAATPAGRMAEPAELGDVIAMLCGAQLGFMTGQNIIIDGGAYPGLF